MAKGPSWKKNKITPYRPPRPKKPKKRKGPKERKVASERKADIFAGEDSVADKLRKRRELIEKQLNGEEKKKDNDDSSAKRRRKKKGRA